MNIEINTTATAMKTNLRRLFLVLALLVSSASSYAADKLKVVATIPDLADIVRQIGGDRVEVTTICKGLENAHLVTPKPSHLVARRTTRSSPASRASSTRRRAGSHSTCPRSSTASSATCTRKAIRT